MIKSTLRVSPLLLVVYGAKGVGKSSFAAGCPGVVFIPLEDGLKNINTRAIDRPRTWEELLTGIAELTASTECQAIAIDTLDAAEQLCWEFLYRTVPGDKGKKVARIEDYGYGKGYTHAVTPWRLFLAAIERTIAAGKSVILIAHHHRKMVKNPTGDDYEQWQIRIHEKISNPTQDMADIVAFAEFDIATVDEGDGFAERTKGKWSGKRILRTSPSAGYEHKSRYKLGDRPLVLQHGDSRDWQALADAIARGGPPSVEALTASLGLKLADLRDPAVTKSCADFLAEHGETIDSLADAIASVDGYLAEKKQEKKA